MSLARFKLAGELVVITGGGGLLGRQHAEAIGEIGGIPVILDVDGGAARSACEQVRSTFSCEAVAYQADVTREDQLRDVLHALRDEWRSPPYGLINNACLDPKYEDVQMAAAASRVESFSLDRWHEEMEVGLTGAFLCAKVFGTEMAKRGRGVILNISSDLGLVGPDQRLYLVDGLEENRQAVKPVTYSVIKHGVIGLTRYLATYWAHRGVRCNALAPGGVYNGQPEAFVEKLSERIPLGRMARPDEYKEAVQFLISDASSYMTGSCLVMDGGRSCW